jgi:VanZ family protein
MARATLSRWAPVVLWAGVIFVLSAIPSLSTGLGTWDLVLRKGAHLAEFAILGALLVRALRSAPLALLAGSAYAATDEVHQVFVSGRQGSTLDWLIDTIGVAAGIFVFARLAASKAS